MADSNNNNGGSSEYETASAFMASLMSNDRILEVSSEPEPTLEIGELHSKYDNLTEEELIGGKQEKVQEQNCSSAPEPASAPQEQDFLHDRLAAILSGAPIIQSEPVQSAPEPSATEMVVTAHAENVSDTVQPTEETTTTAIATSISSSVNANSNPEAANESAAPEPGNTEFVEKQEEIKIVVDSAPPPASESDNEQAVFDAYEPTSDVVDRAAPIEDTVSSAPEPGSTEFKVQEESVVSSAPEPGSTEFKIQEESAVSSAPEPAAVAPVVEEPVSSAPEPSSTEFKQEASATTAEEEEEEEDTFVEMAPKPNSLKKRDWSIPEEPSTGTLDKFGTIRKNIRRGNTTSLRAMWERMNKA